jgi:hypothetical protein
MVATTSSLLGQGGNNIISSLSLWEKRGNKEGWFVYMY